MSFDFPRIEAGRYSVTQNKKMVGYIEKQSSSKWIAYICENVAMKGKPRAVKKTLKECKEVFPTLVSEIQIDENSSQLDDLIAGVQEEERKQMMREMMEKHELEINEYWFGKKDNVSEPSTEFLTEEELVTL